MEQSFSRREYLERDLLHKILHLGAILHHMRRDQMRFKCGDALPFFDDDHDVVARGPLHGQSAGRVDGRKVLVAAVFSSDLRYDLVKLGEKLGPFAWMQLDGGKN